MAVSPFEQVIPPFYWKKESQIGTTHFFQVTPDDPLPHYSQESRKELDPHKAEWVNIGEDELKLRINFLAEKLAQTLGFPQEDLLPLIRVPSYKLNIRGPQANLRTRAVANAINDKLKLNIAEQK